MRRLLFLDGDRAVAYRCSRRAIHCEAVFDADTQGLAAYRAWLAQAPAVPVHILVDAPDEAYHNDRIPPANRRERGVLRRRAAERYLAETPYRTVRTHWRDRDAEHILVVGLRDRQRWRAWLEPIDELGAALAAIASLPLLGERLLAPDDVARRVGITGELASPYADIVFARLALRAPGHANHYAPPQLRRHLWTRRTRTGLWALAASMAVAAAMTAPAGWWAERAYDRAIARANARAERVQAAYHQRLEPLTRLAPEPATVEAVAAGMGRLANATPPDPGAAMAAVGDVLADGHASIEVAALRVGFGAPDSAGTGEADAAPALAIDGTARRARIRLQGRVTGVDGRRWRAQRRVAALRDDLTAHAELADVALADAPYAPQDRQRASGDDDRAPVPFTLELTWEGRDAGA